LVLFVYKRFGDWRPVFLLTGSLGVLWLLIWRVLYRKPEEHPRLATSELEHIQRGRDQSFGEKSSPSPLAPRTLSGLEERAGERRPFIQRGRTEGVSPESSPSPTLQGRAGEAGVVA